MNAFWSDMPVDIIFFSASKIQNPGFRWAPKNFFSRGRSRELGRWWSTESQTPRTRRTHANLEVELESFTDAEISHLINEKHIGIVEVADQHVHLYIFLRHSSEAEGIDTSKQISRISSQSSGEITSWAILVLNFRVGRGAFHLQWRL